MQHRGTEKECVCVCVCVRAHMCVHVLDREGSRVVVETAMCLTAHTVSVTVIDWLVLLNHFHHLKDVA